MARQPSSFSFQCALFVSLVLVGTIAVAPAAAQTAGRPDCADSPTTDVILPNGYPFDTDRAISLFRFHRQKEALRELDAARKIARGPWRWRIPPDRRDDVAGALDALRDCLAKTRPPQMSTLSVRVLGYADEPDRSEPLAGARVYVDRIAVGRTGRDGRLTARVPSGPIGVEAEVPISYWNWTDINLAPGQSESIEINLSDGKEVAERTNLVLTEVVDDILPRTSTSLTLKFMRDGRLAPVETIDQVFAVNSEGDLKAQLDEYFRVVRGEIVATNARRVFEALTPQFGETIGLQVQAMASETEMHYGEIAFRVGQSPLSVTLVAPPSNPSLSMSKIEVGISLLGAGVAVQRVSDANGRLEIDSFPHGTVAFECVSVAAGKYYYGHATMVHSAPRSVTLVLRHVDDVKNGVAPLRVDAPTANDDLPLVRTISPPPPREEGIARIRVAATEKDRTNAMSTTLTVPRGSERLMLAYRISTLERRRDPRFDDVWTLSVFGEDGQRLLSVVRNTNAQHSTNPNWQSDNTTGRMQEVFDIAARATHADARLTLTGTVVNIGDDLYPTTVEALITAVDKGWGPTRRSPR